VSKEILITGGTGKVGARLVAYFLKQDFRVISTSRKKENFDSVIQKNGLESKKNNLFICEVDFKNDEAIDIIQRYLLKNDLSPNIVVHNARSLEYLKINNDGKSEPYNIQMEYYMAVTFPYLLTNVLLDLGSLKNVIFVSSIYGVVAPTPSLYDDFESSSPIQYGVSKAAQIHLVKELAVRMAPIVRVNCVSFGGIKGRTSKEFQNKYEELTPQRKMLNEDDVEGPVDFLVSEKSKDMTGQNIIVDGGWTVW
jgi:NAD(P)-dependent dehydrogenase (short-subunit alcohol dehydrogenase family)